MSFQQTVSQLGEESVLSSISEIIGPHNAKRSGLIVGLGDDAAVVDFGHRQVVMTTDTMSQGQDFRSRWWQSAQECALDVGTKAAAQNLSDINAMGITATALQVSLTLPPETPVAWVKDFYRGIIRACCAAGARNCLITGGDLASGDVVSVTMTAMGGVAEDGALLRRRGAQVGDVVAVAGPLGSAAAGLAILERDSQSDSPASDASATSEVAALIDACVSAQRRPAPPLRAGPAALEAGATAGMDLSDGLLRDATRMAIASGVRIRLHDGAITAEADKLQPVADALGLDGAEPVEWVLTGGEDYSLLTTFGAGAVLPEGFRLIGEVIAGCTPSESPHVLTDHRVTGEGWDSVTG